MTGSSGVNLLTFNSITFLIIFNLPQVYYDGFNVNKSVSTCQ